MVRRREGGKIGRLEGSIRFLPRFIIAGLLFITSFILYIRTLAPSVVTIFDDSLEFQLVTYQLGIAHPTGYPLYTLLGKLFTLIVPVGDVAYRVNLMSAFFGAATIALVYVLILQIIAPKNGGVEAIYPSTPPPLQSSSLPSFHPSWISHTGGIFGAALLAVSSIFWQQATIAEVYTLNAFFVVTLLLLAISFPFQGEGRSGYFGIALVAGLALAHHRTILLLFPALALYMYLGQKPGFWKQAEFYKTLLLSILAGLAPLLFYLYLPLRGEIGSLDGTYQNTWAGFWRQVSAGGYGTFIFDNPFGQERNAAFYWHLFSSQFYTLVPGFIGLIYLAWRGNQNSLVLTGVGFLTYVTFNIFYNVSDIEVFFIPPLMLWAAWSGVGLVFLLRIVAALIPTTDRISEANDQGFMINRKSLMFAATTIVLVLFVAVIFQLFQTNLPIVTARNTWHVHDYGLDMLQQPLPKQAAIVGILGEMTLLRYFQQTENRRPDIETVAADAEADRLVAVEKLLAEGKVVYLTRELPGAPEHWSLNAVGPLIQVNSQPVIAWAQPAFVVNQPVTPQISLLGYDLSRPPHTGPGPAPIRLTLFWQATERLTTSLKVSARLLNSAGEVAAAVDAIPVHFAYPTTAWRPGEIVADVYDLVLPVDAPPGSYTPLLIWYDPAQNASEVGRTELEPTFIK